MKCTCITKAQEKVCPDEGMCDRIYDNVQINAIFIRLTKGKRVAVTAAEVSRLLNYSLSVAGDYQFKIVIRKQKIYIEKYPDTNGIGKK